MSDRTSGGGFTPLDETARPGGNAPPRARLRLLVTGGMGFIGSNFVRYTCRSRPEWTILNLDKLTYAGNPANLADVEAASEGATYRHVRGDICDTALVMGLLADGVNVVVNFAAESHVDRSILDAGPFLQTNVIGTHVLLNAVRGIALTKFIQVSTDEVYGPAPEGTAFAEGAPLRPSSPYAASKAAADLLCRAFLHTHGVPAIIARCTNNFGPYQYPEKFIPLVITRAIDGESIPIYGDGRQVRDWLHVEDTCEALCRMVEAGHPGEVYNVAGAGGVSNVEVASRILRLIDRPPSLLQYVEDRPGHDRRYAMDDAKTRATLGHMPRCGFERGLADTVKWYMAHEEWWRPIKSGEFRRFYDSWYMRT